MWERAEGIAPTPAATPSCASRSPGCGTLVRPGHDDPAGDGGGRPAVHAARATHYVFCARTAADPEVRMQVTFDGGRVTVTGLRLAPAEPLHPWGHLHVRAIPVSAGPNRLVGPGGRGMESAHRFVATGRCPASTPTLRSSCMKPTLASALALGCVSAALVATAGNSQAAPTHADRTRGQHQRRPRQRPGRTPASPAARAWSFATPSWTPTAPATSASTRTYKGLEVVGGDFVVHQAKGGAFRSVSGRTLSPFQLPTTAVGHGRRPPPRRPPRSSTSPRPRATHDLVVLAVHRAPTLAWQVDVTGRNADGSPAGEYVFVGARNGKVLDQLGLRPRGHRLRHRRCSTAPSPWRPRCPAASTRWSTPPAAATRRTTAR